LGGSSALGGVEDPPSFFERSRNAMITSNKQIAVWMFLSTALIGACGTSSSVAPVSFGAATIQVDAKTIELQKSKCAEQFVAHELAHKTTAPGPTVIPYDTNGSGLAVGDLNADGLVDVVLGDLAGTTSVMWNTGAFRFERTPLDDVEGGLSETETRAVSIIDVDGDGRLDIVTSHTKGGVSVWHNNGNQTFTSTTIDELIAPAYALMWDDLDQDGDVDLVTASYDALLEKTQGNTFLLSAGGGVVVYLKDGATFTGTRLERKTQTLAMTLLDVDADGIRDLIVGNDFGVPDMIWKVEPKQGPSKWKRIKPFARITKNTMGYAVGDPNNDGRFDLFASDMKPNLGDMQMVADWMPLVERPFQKLQRSDIQRAENTFQVQRSNGHFDNKGYVRGMDATGWSWSTQFGDLDNDGKEDLYVVNGMIDHEVLPYLKNDEIIEPNVTFKGHGDATFERNPDWGLTRRESGRSMAMADLNNDGRLDIIINNLRSRSMVMENTLCIENSTNSLSIKLNWEGVGNRSALGAIVYVQTSSGTKMRAVTATGGYLTGLDGTVNVGIGTATVTAVGVHWPDGQRSVTEIDQSTEGARTVSIVRAGR
jgi:enediyne biosynthesis protein E4